MTSDDAKLRPVFALESGPAAGVVAALGMAQATRDRERDRIRHGRHHRQGVADRERRHLPRARVRGRWLDLGRQPADPRRRRAAADPDDRHRRGRRRRRQHRLARPGRRACRSARGAPAPTPGPACYGRGGVEPTVTDANVVLGFMPAGQVADGQITIQPELAEAAVRARRRAARADRCSRRPHGIHRIANARMTRALRSVSSEKGRDPRDFAIIAYGGSGPVHAGGLADELGVTTVLVPPVAGLFSAVGLLFARPEFHEVRSCHLDVDAVDPGRVAALLDEMEAVLVRRSPVATSPAWAAHRRPPLRRPELGGRGRAAAEARSTAALLDGAAGAVRGRARGALRRARPARLAGRGAGGAARGARRRPRRPVVRRRRRARRPTGTRRGGCGSAARRPRCRSARAPRSEPRPRRAAARRRVRHHGRRPARLVGPPAPRDGDAGARAGERGW